MAYGIQPQSDPTAVMGRRIVAYIIDSIVSFVVIVVVLALTKSHVYTGAPSDACRLLRDSPGGFSGQCLEFGSRVYTWTSHRYLIGYVAGGVVSLANLVVLQGMTGASIGKMILGLRVVDSQGDVCGVGRAFLRWLVLIVLDGACFLIGLIVASATHPHRRVGDYAGGTYVVALARAGRPVVAAPAAPPYAYAHPGTPGWTPPGTTPPPAPGWGATPPPGPGWGTAPPPASATRTDAPPPPSPQSTPPPPLAAWGSPAASETSTPPPAPAAPTPLGAAPQDRSGWGAPPSTWKPPAPEPSAATPPPPPAPEPAAPAAPEEPTAAPPAPKTPGEGESWWNRALDDDSRPSPPDHDKN